MPLDLTADTVTVTEQLVNIFSVSLDEKEIADQVEESLTGIAHLVVTRRGHTVIARTDLGRDERVVIAGHIDTVPLNDNLPARRDEEFLHGLGACDMKAGVAVALKLAAELTEPNRDVTYIFYEAEEIEAEHNGLSKLSESDPDLMAADFAILMEPSNAVVEAGCQGTMRIDVRLGGERAHSARSWMGDNAIHKAGAEAFLREFFAGHDVTVTDAAPGALPGLAVPAAAAFLAAVGGEANPKFGWTDVARFSGLGVPAVNFGPGDPLLAHKQEEHVPFAHIERCEQQLRTWLGER